RQLHNPVGVNLMGGVEVRDSAATIRIKCIRQAASRRSDVYARAGREACGVGSDVDRLGIGVVEVELNSVAELLPQAGLQCVVIRSSDGAPREHAGRLIVERITCARPKTSASRRSAEGVELPGNAKVVPKALVDIDIPKPHHLVAEIRDAWAVVEVVNGLNKAR